MFCWKWHAVGVCGSDLHQWTAEHSWPVNYPVILGHEFSGRVAKTGSNVKNFKEGDRVVSETAAVINPIARWLALVATTWIHRAKALAMESMAR